MSFLRHNTDLIKKGAAWLAVLIAIRVLVNRLLGDRADEPVSTPALIILAAFVALIALATVVGLVMVVRRQRRILASRKIAVRADMAWPPTPPAQTPDDRNTDRADLAAAGFVQIASIDVSSDFEDEVRAVLLSEDSTIVVTKASQRLELISDFGGRALTTANEISHATASHEFGQAVPFGRYEQVSVAHRQALGLATGALGPATSFTQETALDHLLELEAARAQRATKPSSASRLAHALAWPFGLFGDRPTLANDRSSQERIARWASRAPGQQIRRVSRNSRGESS